MIYENKRIRFLDGIRGWASILVLLSHLIPNFVGLINENLRFTKADLASSIANCSVLKLIFFVFLKFFTDGHLAVMIFFILSGYAISSALLKKDNINLAALFISRYIRLFIPIFLICLIILTISKLELFYNKFAVINHIELNNWLGSFYTFELNFSNFIKFTSFDVFFKYDDRYTFNAALWTISYELYGSLILYLYIYVKNLFNSIGPLITSIITLILLIFSPFLACFLIGHLIMILNLKSKKKSYNINKYFLNFIIPLFLILVSVFFRNNNTITIFIATAFLVYVTHVNYWQEIFSNKLSLFLGRISFTLYLIHIPIICSLTSYLFINFYNRYDLNVISLISLVFLTILVSIAISMLLTPIDRFGVKLSKTISDTIARSKK